MRIEITESVTWRIEELKLETTHTTTPPHPTPPISHPGIMPASQAGSNRARHHASQVLPPCECAQFSTFNFQFSSPHLKIENWRPSRYLALPLSGIMPGRWLACYASILQFRRFLISSCFNYWTYLCFQFWKCGLVYEDERYVAMDKLKMKRWTKACTQLEHTSWTGKLKNWIGKFKNENPTWLG